MFSMESSWTPFLNPFSKRQILESSKLDGLADDNFKFRENGRKFSKWVETTVEKGENAHYEQFLLSISVLRGLILQTRKNQGLFGKRLHITLYRW